MTKLSSDTYYWAIHHLQEASDTDLFPRPFEIDAIASFKDHVVNFLTQIEVENYNWVGGRYALIPKEMVSFRRAIQLDPLDSIVLAALVREFGASIEKRRIAPKKEIVFSYRFNPGDEGNLYNPDSSWNKFWQASLNKAESMGGWIVSTDISDYYNHISHERINNELISAKLPESVVETIMRLLSKLTHGIPRGLPVGPHSIHLIAECAFDPVDRSLLSRGYEFCRYVDDIHIFCKSQEDAYTALFNIADIVDKQQNLTLQRHKTEIISANEFIEKAKGFAQEAPLSDLEREIVEVIDRYSGGNRYESINLANLTPEEQKILGYENIAALFNIYLEQDEPDYARIRWLFRRLAQVGVPGAIPVVLSRINILLPALADVGQYIVSVQDNLDDDFSQMGEELLNALKLPIITHSEYLSETLLSLYSLMPSLNHIDDILRMYPNASPFEKRQIVRAATAQNADYWLRERKNSLLTSDLWLRRALIAAASAFNSSERDAWLKPIDEDGSELEKIIAEWTKEESEDAFLYELDPELVFSEENIVEKYRNKLLKILDSHFSEEDLRTFCFNLNVDYENLPAVGKANKARELIKYLERRGRIQELVKLGKAERPNVNWDQ